ncbi:glycosyltransferase family 2 protein [Campylobacter sp. RM12327]|uniref:glycosyltransferase family 2 protein n=1 Tax=Campylobacter sputorum TaxID=206 RepID=UPI000B78D411|nr:MULTISPECIES: glycosyltransferase family 2 protein [Campylobacter]ASM40520.1 glycosyltransferase, family 2 [Campylobacter sputorum]MBE7357815.1 glycosyltransferase family 2 protein [Campylobacter sp. RM11302]MBF6669093.1 glycosyltransferase family 2 protein [Campylobacter sp. RM12327]MBF6673898.1 glycosyltransferase family 2 protein [Campylobacter sp. RM13538]MBF6675833.1 glycosyltransferase family 2 protein [Campylobacter sp. RM12321]
MQINGSIVLYKNDIKKISKVIDSFLANKNLEFKLYLLDNSPNNDLNILSKKDNRIEYIFNNANLGYGKAHNIAIKKSINDGALYHVILNPDIYFDNTVINGILKYMEQNLDVGNIMPKVLYPDGEIQYLCKLLPTPIDLVFRRFIPFKGIKDMINERYELYFSQYDKIVNIPNLSGCFMFLRVEALKEVGLFDENIFMYLEDVDLNRRIHQKYKTMFYPHVQIYHEHGKESYKNKKLLKAHIKSAIYYFNKWGWFFDKDRKKINNKCINSLL